MSIWIMSLFHMDTKYNEPYINAMHSRFIMRDKETYKIILKLLNESIS